MEGEFFATPRMILVVPSLMLLCSVVSETLKQTYRLVLYSLNTKTSLVSILSSVKDLAIAVGCKLAVSKF